MLFKVFVVYDSKTEVFGQPFFMKSKGEAVRGFTEVSNDQSSTIGKYPSDFTLFELGSFDDACAKFIMHSTPTSIGLALEFLKPSIPEFCDVSGSKLSKVV